MLFWRRQTLAQLIQIKGRFPSSGLSVCAMARRERGRFLENHACPFYDGIFISTEDQTRRCFALLFADSAMTIVKPGNLG